MDLDLHLFAPEPLSPTQVETWLRSRPRWHPSAAGATYEHPVTGVYFALVVSQEPGQGALIRVGLRRPHVFAAEAAVELAALCADLGLRIQDPLGRTDEPVDFDAETFRLGWAARAQAALAELPSPGPSLEGRVWEACWRLGYRRLELQLHLHQGGHEVYVPPVLLFQDPRHPSQALTGVLWSELVPIALPRVEVLLVSGPLAPQGPRALELSALWPLLEQGQVLKAGATWTWEGVERRLPLDLALVDRPSGELVQALRAAPDLGRLRRLPAEAVLTRELLSPSAS